MTILLSSCLNINCVGSLQMPSAPHLGVSPKEPETGRAQQMENSESGEAGRLALLPFDKMPESFQQDNNRWIRHGYRPISHSIRASFRSWWYLHNETVNIYTHLVPAVVFFLGEWYTMQYLAGKYPRITNTDFAVFSSFMLTATICYASSAVYHTLMNHSHKVERFCHRLDMLGIAVFIVGDIVLGVHIMFWCETKLRNIYWSMVSWFSYSRLSPSQGWQSELTLSPSANRSEFSGH
jgi:adiponectin receptor